MDMMTIKEDLDKKINQWDAITMCDLNGDADKSVTSIIMKDVETGLKYKLVIRNGELCIEGAETQSIRDVKINTILK